jgi:hypothetical protein
MATHSITKLAGVGKATEALFENKGIRTVQELAECDPSTLVEKYRKFIDVAKEHIKQQEKVAASLGIQNLQPSPTLMINGTETKEVEQIEPETTAAVEKEEQEEQTRLLIEEHTWWEHNIMLPRESKDADIGYELRSAAIYEVSLEAFNRISVICSWVPDDNEDALCSMSYSPQFILDFNRNTLPPLQISLDRDTWNSLPNKHTIENVLWECSVLHAFNTGL